MSKTTIAIISLIVGAGAMLLYMSAGSLTTPQELPKDGLELTWEENPYETIPIIDAYFEGEKIWFLHTDVSNDEMAERLTKMVNYQSIYSEKLADLPTDKVGKFYVFTNGILQNNVKPWGGGPFAYQIDIFDSIPGDPDYVPVRNPSLVSWVGKTPPRILKSLDELLEAEENGEVIIEPTDVIVNVPIVKWPGDYLGGQSRIEK